MGNLLEPGGGVPGATALLSDMWRSVYKKAADAAEARLAALLADHVYRQHGRRAVSVILDGGGAVLTAGARCDLEVPWAYIVEGWVLYADQPGGLVLDLLVAADYTAYGSFVSIAGGSPPTLDALAPTDKARADELPDWNVQLPRGRVLRVAVTSADVVTRATLTLFLRAV